MVKIPVNPLSNPTLQGRALSQTYCQDSDHEDIDAATTYAHYMQ